MNLLQDFLSNILKQTNENCVIIWKSDKNIIKLVSLLSKQEQDVVRFFLQKFASLAKHHNEL